jgi:hypothetical protein
MRTLIKLVIVAAICVGGIGWWRGWFTVSKQNPSPDGNTVDMNLSVDKRKIKSDVREVKKKIKEEIRELEGKVKGTQPN